jgi:hypothetical protein
MRSYEEMRPEHHLSYAIYQLTRVQNYLLKRNVSRADVNAIDLIGIAQNAVRAEFELHRAVRVYKETKSGVLPDVPNSVR